MSDTRRRVRGRLAPEAMYPAGVPGVVARRVTLPSGITLRLAESGVAVAPAVVLVHGWGASLYMWRDWFAPLVAAGFRAVAVDLPGHGLADKPGPGAYTLPHLVAVVRELFDVEQLDGAAVVAQSMGGSIMLELALGEHAPVGRLALVNPASFGRVKLQPLARLASPPLVDSVIGRVMPRWIVARAHRLAYSNAARITARDIDEYWAPSQFPAYARAMRLLLHEFQWQRAPADVMARRLAVLAHPVLAVLGGRDHLVHDAMPYAAALRAAGARLEIVELAEAGHAVNEEEPAVVVARVLAHFA